MKKFFWSLLILLVNLRVFADVDALKYLHDIYGVPFYTTILGGFPNNNMSFAGQVTMNGTYEMGFGVGPITLSGQGSIGIGGYQWDNGAAHAYLLGYDVDATNANTFYVGSYWRSQHSTGFTPIDLRVGSNVYCANNTFSSNAIVTNQLTGSNATFSGAVTATNIVPLTNIHYSTNIALNTPTVAMLPVTDGTYTWWSNLYSIFNVLSGSGSGTLLSNSGSGLVWAASPTGGGGGTITVQTNGVQLGTGITTVNINQQPNTLVTGSVSGSTSTVNIDSTISSSLVGLRPFHIQISGSGTPSTYYYDLANVKDGTITNVASFITNTFSFNSIQVTSPEAGAFGAGSGNSQVTLYTNGVSASFSPPSVQNGVWTANSTGTLPGTNSWVCFKVNFPNVGSGTNWHLIIDGLY